MLSPSSNKKKDREGWTVQSRLNLMIFLLVFSSSMAVFGAFQIYKGSKFHQYNFLHIKYNYEFNQAVDSFSNGEENISELSRLIKEVQAQPIDCLNDITTLDRLTMKLIETYRAVAICEMDIELGNQILADLSEFENKAISRNDIEARLYKSIEGFSRNSAEFSPLIDKTVSVTRYLMVGLIVFVSIICCGLWVLVARNISRDYEDRKQIGNELLQHKEHLEELVAQRTAELEKAYVLIKENETYLSSIISSMVHGLVVITDKGIIKMTNPEVEQMFGYSSTELLGKNVAMLMPEPDTSNHDQYIQNYLTTGKAKIIGLGREVEAMKRDGAIFPIHIGISKVLVNDKTLYLGVVQDITERRAFENDLKVSKEAAEKANFAKSEFLSKMSHELRTPLNAILGFSQLEILRGEKNGADDKRLANIRQINSSGEHLLDLINEVLDLSRIESGTMLFSVESINVNSLLDEIYSQSKSLGKQYDVSLLFSQQKDSVYIDADRTRLRQVLLNLLSNGIKYNKPGGVTQLVILNMPEAKVRISIKDQGQGIAEDQVSRLFTPFDRLDAEQTAIEGTGIGLAIAKQMTEAMGGKIGLESKVGEGCEFYIEFPMVLPPAKKLSSAVLKSVDNLKIKIPGNRKIKLLYIEDNPANVLLIARLFDQFENIELLTAGESVEGFELLSSHSFDLILLDIHLPGMNGFEIFKHLAKDDKVKHIPVIALSAGAIQADIDKALDMGFHSYLTKPLNLPQVCKTINEIFA